MAELVRVKDKFQVTIPVAVREAAAIRAGDYLEVSVVPEGVLLRPQRLVSTATTPRSVRTILDYLAETRPVSRSKEDIDRDLNAQRDQW